MKKNFINIGIDAIGHPVNIDLETLLVTRALVQGASGAGKSRFLRRMAEQAFGTVPIIILDPEGEFASLRERFGFVLAGRGGETPADPRSAAMLATKLLELRASAVCDLYYMKPLERHTFVRLFIESLMNADKRLWHPCIVMVDEAHRVCPEKGAGESEAKEAMTALATDGRKRGLCPIFATQRISKLSKDAAAELLNVFIGQTFIHNDRTRAADSLGVDKGSEQRDLFAKLKVMPRGSFYALGQAVSLDAILIKTGEVETSHPKVGAKAVGAVPPAPAAIKKLLPQLADLPKQAEDKARTESELRKEIADLRKQLKAAPVATHAAPSKEALSAEFNRGWEGGIAHADRESFNSRRAAWRALKRIQEANDRTSKAITEELAYYPEDGPEKPKAGERAPRPATVAPVAKVTRIAKIEYPKSSGKHIANVPLEGPLTGPEQRIVDAIAWLNAIGIENPENSPVAFLARYSPNGTSYTNPRSALKSKALIDYPTAGTVRLTPTGASLAHPKATPVDADELQQVVLSLLTGPEQRIMKPVLKAYPEMISNEKVAEEANYSPSGTSYTNPRSHLRSLTLIDYPQSGQLRAAKWLFLE